MALGDGMKMAGRSEDTLQGLSSLLGQFKKELRAEVDGDVRALSAKVDALQRTIASMKPTPPQVHVQSAVPTVQVSASAPTIEVFVPDPPEHEMDFKPIVESNKRIESLLTKLLSELSKPTTKEVHRDPHGLIESVTETRGK